MRVGLRNRLTFSNVISMIALFVALGGVGAYAADKLGSKDIAKNAIKSKHIKADAATGEDVDEGSLGTVPRATRASSADAAENAENADFAEFAGDAETLEGFFADEFQLGDGSDVGGAGVLGGPGQQGAYEAFDGDVVITCDDTTPTVRWDDRDDDSAPSDVWIDGTHEMVADGNSSAAINLDPEDTAEVHVWGGNDTIALVHASVSSLGLDDFCFVNFTAQENFNSNSAAAAAAGDTRRAAGTTKGLSDR